ncbi:MULTISPECIES: hypothetical protein [Deinococcus]|uniref:Uncharacterized protein n=1 Tax=Deinococcus rufus TaxID=2136097 RepID=A0ABV7ZF09_9DEIO|nr:hypothetical protein [Deinococcus sp. AB2017081]WQE94003.1 hypothetical protein U2P90_11345 [Deinococcus sp. AB2017081]
MIPELHLLPPALSWIVHPAAAFALIHWAGILYSRRGRVPGDVLWAAGIIVVIGVLGAAWVAHPAAGMLLGFFGQRAFRRWSGHVPALLAGLVAAAAFMALGATWLMFPLTVMAVIWATTAGLTGRQVDLDERLPQPAALPEHAGGLPVIGTENREAVPVTSTSTVTAATRTAVPDAFTALHLDERLPGDIRAQLAALDLRTAEALTHLRALGQEGSEGAYVARTIRDEYAPASVRAYLNLPRTRADVTPIEDGKTGRDLLREQLDLLLNAVQDILDATLHAGGQELLTHQRFLREKFGKKARELDV